MKKLLCVAKFCLIFSLVLCNIDFSYAESILGILTPAEYDAYHDKLEKEAASTVTEEMVNEFNNSFKKNMDNVNDRCLSWRAKFKKNIEQLANKNDKYVRLKEIVDELDAMCITYQKNMDPNSVQVLCDEGLTIKDLSFFHYCKAFSYFVTGKYQNSFDEFSKMDDKLKLIIPNVYRYIGRLQFEMGHIEEGLESLRYAFKNCPTFFVVSDLVLANYNLKRTNTKEYLDAKKILLLLTYTKYNKW